MLATVSKARSVSTQKSALTCSFIHRELVGQDAPDLAEGRHLDPILLQLALHVVDFLFCRTEWRPSQASFVPFQNSEGQMLQLLTHERLRKYWMEALSIIPVR